MKILLGVLRVVFGFIGVFWAMVGSRYAFEAGMDGAYGPMAGIAMHVILGVAMVYWAFVRFPWETADARDRADHPRVVRFLFGALRVLFGLLGVSWTLSGAWGGVRAGVVGAYGVMIFALFGALIGVAVAYWAFVRLPWERSEAI